MTESILDNQELTAEMLNNISVDLGGDDLSFTSTEKFGADKLNKITGDLVGAGILSGGTNQGDNCKIYTANDKIYIKSGIIVFADGKKKTIDTDTEIAELQNCAIYALNNTSLNTIQIIADVGGAYPASGDFVKLARISQNSVIDDRSISIAKVDALGARTVQELTDWTISTSTSTQSEIALTNSKPGVIFGKYVTVNTQYRFMYNITEDKYYSVTYNGVLLSDYDYLPCGNYAKLKFAIIDNKLKATLTIVTSASLVTCKINAKII